MRVLAAFLLASAIVAWAAPARAEVQLTIEGGHVSLKATNATVREILAEWARVGRTKIVNGERMPGGPITIELNGVSEEEALEILLRSAAGYVTAPRAVAETNASRYDRILVMPTSSPTRPGAAAISTPVSTTVPAAIPGRTDAAAIPAAVSAAAAGKRRRRCRRAGRSRTERAAAQRPAAGIQRAGRPTATAGGTVRRPSDD